MIGKSVQVQQGERLLLRSPRLLLSLLDVLRPPFAQPLVPRARQRAPAALEEAAVALGCDDLVRRAVVHDLAAQDGENGPVVDRVALEGRVVARRVQLRASECEGRGGRRKRQVLLRREREREESEGKGLERRRTLSTVTLDAVLADGLRQMTKSASLPGWIVPLAG